MLRLFFAVFVPAIILAAMLHISVWVIVIPIAILALLAYTVGGSKLRCPSCRKRVKIGATACHHCGRDVRTGAAA